MQSKSPFPTKAAALVATVLVVRHRVLVTLMERHIASASDPVFFHTAGERFGGRSNAKIDSPVRTGVLAFFQISPQNEEFFS